jgi:PAS domain S-box-containing protein
LELVVSAAQEVPDNFATKHAHLLRIALAVLVINVAYYIGAQIGFALTFQPHPVSTLWPPNSILLATLLLCPSRRWWFLLLTAFPAHFLVQMNADIPLSMLLCWFVSNCSEALIGAVVLQYLTGKRVRFDDTYHVGMFMFAAILGPFLSSFLDAAFVILNAYGTSTYWEVFRMRVFSNVLASFTLVPVILTWQSGDISTLLRSSAWRYLEAFLLATGLLVVGLVSFGTQKPGPNTTPALLYLPLPLLLWAAIRFGPRGSSTALLAVSFFAIWGATHGLGPFATQSAEMNALSVQLFLILASMPLMFLTALIRERERAQKVARQKEERLQMALDAAEMGTWDWRIPEKITDWSDQTKRIFGFTPADPELSPAAFYALLHADDQVRIKEAVDKAISHGTAYEEEFRIPLKDDTVRWVRGVGKVIVDEAGRPIRMMGVNLDVTKRKRVEEELHETSERHRAILRALPDLVFLMSREGVYLDYHARDNNTLIMSPRFFLGKSVREVLPACIAERVMECLARTATTREPQVLEYSLAIQNVERYFEARIIGMDSEKSLSIVRDVTDREIASQSLKESQEQLRRSHRQVSDLLARLIHVQESERRRISRELHDDLSQKVATMSVEISRLKKRVPTSEAQFISAMDKLREHSNHLADEIRRLSHQLHPAVLEHLGLVAALRSFIQSFESDERIDVNFAAHVSEENIPFQTSICMYRVAVEALRNVSRHSGASSAVVSLKTLNNWLELQVSDSGKGFDLESVRKSGGLGLVSIEERLRLLQGTYEIKSNPETGTTLVATVPLLN